MTNGKLKMSNALTPSPSPIGRGGIAHLFTLKGKLGEGLRIFALVIGLWSLGIISAQAETYYYPQYWITGKLTAPSGVDTNNRQIVLFENLDMYRGGVYVIATSNGDSYTMNTFAMHPAIPPFVSAGQTYKMGVVKGSDNYGVSPVDVKITGKGVEVVNFTLKASEGIEQPKPQGGQPPRFENIKFGNRLYQPALVAKGEKFIVSPTTKISATVKSDYGIYTKAEEGGVVSIILNQSGSPTPQQKLDLDQSGMTVKAREAGLIKELTFTQNVPEDKKLGEGLNTVTFYALNAYGSTSEVANVTIMSGPLSIVGDVLTFPSPYSPTKHINAAIQYTLSADGDIDIILVSGAKQVVKKIVCFKGSEGGSAGVNKVAWNGQTDQGFTIGDGIYSGALVSRTEGKVLARFKLTVVD